MTGKWVVCATILRRNIRTESENPLLINKLMAGSLPKLKRKSFHFSSFVRTEKTLNFAPVFEKENIKNIGILTLLAAKELQLVFAPL